MNNSTGYGIADGLQNATNTLLQIQMYKQKQKYQQEQDKIKDKYEDARAKYEDMMVDNMAKTSQSYIQQVQAQAVQDYLSKNGGQPPADGQSPQGGQQGGNPIAAASSTLNGNGSLPQQPSTPPYTLIPDGKGHYKTIINNPTPDQAVETYKKAVAAADKAGLKDVNIGLSATGKVTISKETGFQQRTDIAKQTAPSIFNALSKGDYTAYDKSDPMVKDLVGKMASDQGINLDDVRTKFTTINRLASTSGAPQMVRFNSAMGSLNRSLNVLDKLSDDYQRTDFLPSIQNKIKIAIDTQTGPNGDKVEYPKYTVNPKDFPNDTTYQKALAYVTQLNFAKDQLAFVYSGGYSPESGFYNMAQDTIGKYLGNVGERTVSKQVRIEMAIRKKSQDDALQGKVTDSGDDGSGGQGDNQSQDVPTIVNAEGKTMKLSPDGKSWI
jgi:hypothetical protein